jgi:hypothetical protein
VADIPSNVEHISVIPTTDQESLSAWREFSRSRKSNFRLANDLGVGVYEAMNVGIKTALGEYVCFWNAGDELLGLNNALHQTLHILRKEKPNWLLVDGSFDWRESYTPSLNELRNFILHKSSGFISHQTTIVSKDILQRIGNFDSKFKIAADTAVITQLTRITLPDISHIRLVKVEKPNFAARNNRRGRVEALIIAINHLRGKSQMLAVFNIIWGEVHAIMQKILGARPKD